MLLKHCNFLNKSSHQLFVIFKNRGALPLKELAHLFDPLPFTLPSRVVGQSVLLQFPQPL